MSVYETCWVHLSICISLFCSIFHPLPIQRLAIIAYGAGQAIPLLPHIVRQLHRPTLHPNKSTLVLPSACFFPRTGSLSPRSRRRPPPWCSRRGAAVSRSQHGQQNQRNRETTVRREADSPGPTRSMAQVLLFNMGSPRHVSTFFGSSRYQAASGPPNLACL